MLQLLVSLKRKRTEISVEGKFESSASDVMKIYETFDNKRRGIDR
jgi:hypothetical protein